MLKLKGMSHDLGGGFAVRRVLPKREKRMVGPFIFLDHMGPFTAVPEQNIDVRPHPHIGLSTVTYLFQGEIMHRDSVGSEQVILPGDVNWMISGSGISHSERTPERLRGTSRHLHGLQIWVALPDHSEDADPRFLHYNRKDIPVLEDDEKKIKVIAGEGFGLSSPVAITSPLLYFEYEAKRAHSFSLDTHSFEYGVYMIEGSGSVSGEELLAHEMHVIDLGEKNLISVSRDSKFIVIGGEPFKTPRHIWWNLVSSSKEKIEAAKQKWKEGSFPMIDGEEDYIPLPQS